MQHRPATKQLGRQGDLQLAREMDAEIDTFLARERFVDPDTKDFVTLSVIPSPCEGGVSKDFQVTIGVQKKVEGPYETEALPPLSNRWLQLKDRNTEKAALKLAHTLKKNWQRLNKDKIKRLFEELGTTTLQPGYANLTRLLGERCLRFPVINQVQGKEIKREVLDDKGGAHTVVNRWLLRPQGMGDAVGETIQLVLEEQRPNRYAKIGGAGTQDQKLIVTEESSFPELPYEWFGTS